MIEQNEQATRLVELAPGGTTRVLGTGRKIRIPSGIRVSRYPMRKTAYQARKFDI